MIGSTDDSYFDSFFKSGFPCCEASVGFVCIVPFYRIADVVAENRYVRYG